MANHGSRIPLLRADPDLARFMSDDERAAAADVSVPVIEVPQAELDLEAVLVGADVFGALLLDGMLFSHHRVGSQTALRLLGPGDVLSLAGEWSSAVLPAILSAAAPTALGVLGNEFLLAARRWPRIVAGLHARTAEQAERVAAQLTICQLPRVDQRLLAMMWLLAEQWGHVTSAGTRLPINLTHDALGSLVGARRPTITLALGELMERGALVRQERGWLLLEAPVEASGPPPSPPDREILIDPAPSAWEGPPVLPESSVERHDQLMATLTRLKADHLVTRQQVRDLLADLARQRERASGARRRITEEALRRRQAPS